MRSNHPTHHRTTANPPAETPERTRTRDASNGLTIATHQRIVGEMSNRILERPEPIPECDACLGHGVRNHGMEPCPICRPHDFADYERKHSPSSRLANLEAQFFAVRAALAQFVPTTVDLRIDGKVRPVVILAAQEQPATQPAFSVVE